MIFFEKQPVNASFKKASGTISVDFDEDGGGVRRRSGRSTALTFFAVLLSFGLLSLWFFKGSAADAWEGRQENVASVSAIEELRIAERRDIDDISVEDVGRVAQIAPASGESSAAPPQIVEGASGTVSDVPPVVAPKVQAPESLVPAVVSGSDAQAPTQPLSAPAQGAPPAGIEAQGHTKTDAVTRPETPPDEDAYYDALPLPPSGALAKKTAGPREVDPRLEPASRFVIVTKDKEGGSVESLLVAANRALALGRHDAAVDLFDQLYKKNKRDRRVLMGRSVALQKAGRKEAARAAYDELLKLSPDNREAQVNMLGLMAEDYPAVALRRMLDLRKKWPADSGLAAQIGLTQARLGNDREAIEYLGIAASIDPSNASHSFNIAVVADRLGDRDAAIKFYEQALQTDTLHGGGRSVPRDSIYSRLSVLRDQK